MSVWRVNNPQTLGAAMAGARHQAGDAAEVADCVAVNRRYLTVLESGKASLQVQHLLEMLSILGYQILVVPKGTSLAGMLRPGARVCAPEPDGRHPRPRRFGWTPFTSLTSWSADHGS